MTNNELYHYGVLGMRWGVRHNRAPKAYEKASRKLNRITNKVNKREKKVSKYINKANKKQASYFFDNTDKVKELRAEARRHQAKADVYKRRGKQWVDAMQREFKGTGQKLTKEQVAIGKKYTEDLLRSEDLNKMMMYNVTSYY